MSQQAHVSGDTSTHHQAIDLVRSKPKRVLMVVANPAVSTNNGWPVGFWAAELTHPYYELTERGVAVTVASPDGGKVEFDNLSDPRDPSKWSAEDLISLGFVNSPDRPLTWTVPRPVGPPLPFSDVQTQVVGSLDGVAGGGGGWKR